MAGELEISPQEVDDVGRWIRARGNVIVPLINRVRTDLGGLFDTSVAPVERGDFEDELDAVLADRDRAANVAALVVILRQLDVPEDYPGFVVDELLGRELAGMIAGGQPGRLLAEATFHYADATHHPEGDEQAGLDDLDVALAAGFQTRLPGWPWRTEPGPFDAPNERT